MSFLLMFHPFIEHFFHENSLYLPYFEQQSGVLFPNYFFQIYLSSCPYYVIKRSSFLSLPPFSSTTKRSLQPHNDKLLIGSQQSLISVRVICSCFSLALIGFSFRTAVFILRFLSFILDYGGSTALSVVPFMIATTCNVALRQTSKKVNLAWLIHQLLLEHFIP